ncbi:hypothetical protein [Sulfitobacter donghicola]|uniref:50S ribosomal protein L21 n=1 Tax=Sulfitobacter donghicola DSW-25 = KCTC 12864 = JCM 14565 TaxID=1300350 RepID=A0A073ILL4_9RHOB|nr:hypothetical protein [Sulfitobacter donghicola]KEJ90391.1 50S ribosomal protein L21 [Sulfitobacter donghicola DSW-25 = KCTC 12864 = JCM 14565]KIN67620.1 NADH:ubiquinone oxidoreductase 41 kD complex I subunit [Sulfitobacter donghicola DSW-25 = KCTC 12864 = JCM 14565]
MTYLLTQIFLYMLVAFLLGLLLGWLLWRYGRPTSGEIEAMRDENKRLRADLETCTIKKAKLEAQADAQPVAAPIAPVAAPVVAEPAVVEEVYTGPTSKPQGLAAPRSGTADELQLINGVGPKMEKLLHSLGYYHFDQIASWTTSEVAWVDNNLEGFKGRVTRDEWQKQAKVLAAK